MKRILSWRVLDLLRRWAWRAKDRLFAQTRADILQQTEETLRADVRATGRNIRVGFVVCDRAKWSTGPLFEALTNTPGFECGFIMTLSDVGLRLAKSERQKEYAENRTFFETQGPVWCDLYAVSADKIRPHTAINCDVVFIQQPWGMQSLPRQLAGRILCAYVQYGFAITPDADLDLYRNDFHGYLWKHFAQTDADKMVIETAAGSGALVPGVVAVAGYPKLDAFLTPPPARGGIAAWPRPGDTFRQRVIFAPHHAVGQKTLGIATFAWSAHVMDDITYAYPDIDFILKPHPNLGFELNRSRVMPTAQYADWVDAWAARPNCAVFNSGDYLDIFRTSDLMITDSVSFLAEYLPTSAPIIRLMNAGVGGLNAAGKTIEEAFYTAQSGDDLRAVFRSVCVDKMDPLATLRQSKIREIIPFDVPSSQIITDTLRRILREN